ncbi:MAG: hypothetical protein QM765_51520 [Myxococcales bacterium]
MRTNFFRQWKREEGGAAAEFAVLIFVLGPLWMFTMFASDAVQHLMDVQEAVITTTWDLSQVQYGGIDDPDIDGAVKMSRLQFADHDSSFLNEQKIQGGKFSGDAHHVNAFAHTCWCNNNGEGCDNGMTEHEDRSSSHQVYCRKTDKDPYVLSTMTFHEKFNKGAVYECSAKGWLFNFALPEKFVGGIPGNERIPLFSKRKQTGDSAHVSGSSASTADLLLREHAAILTDPWAITELKDLDPGSDHKVPSVNAGDTNSRYYERAQWQFYLGGTWFLQPSINTANFAVKAFSNNILICPSIPPLPLYGWRLGGPREPSRLVDERPVSRQPRLHRRLGLRRPVQGQRPGRRFLHDASARRQRCPQGLREARLLLLGPQSEQLEGLAMRVFPAFSQWATAAAAVALLAAVPASAASAPAPKQSDAKPYGPGPLSAARPPTDPAAYDQALERIRKMPPEEAFGFAAFDNELPVENLGRQTQPGTIRMASLTLKVKPELAFENYRIGLSQKYLPIFQGRMGRNAAYLSFRDPADGFMRTVTVSGVDQTIVLVAISDPDRLLNRPPPTPDHAPVDWPLPPLLGTPADLETVDLGVYQRTRSIQVACSDSAGPLSFFDTHLPEKGWLPDKSSRHVGRESSTEDFRRGDEVCAVVSTFRTGEPCALSIICTARK